MCVCVCVCVSTSLCMHVWLRSYSSFSPLGLLMLPFIDRTLHWLFHHYPTRHFLCCQTFIMWNPRPLKRTSNEGRTEQGGEPGEEQKTMTEPHCRTQSQQSHTHTHTPVRFRSAYRPKRECEWCFEHIKLYSWSYELNKIKKCHWHWNVCWPVL